jgi:voltage-gated potassium channel Kch
LAISSYLLLLKLSDVIFRFETRNGVLRLLSYAKHQVGLSAIIFAATIIVASFGCIHYSISLLNPSSYSRPLTAIDGVYFSVTTFATVGYGDIYPPSPLTKLICVGEIISGCLVLVFGVNVAMTVWLQKFGATNGSDSHKKI